MRVPILAGLAMLAACSSPQPSGPTADVNAAAEAAQGDIDTYAADTLQPAVPAKSAPRAPARTAASVDASQPRASPTPAEADATTGETVANYRCAGETRITARFDEAADTATLRRNGRELAVLTGQRPASGIWYKGGGYELRGKGDAADFTAPGRSPVACTAIE